MKNDSPLTSLSTLSPFLGSPPLFLFLFLGRVPSFGTREFLPKTSLISLFLLVPLHELPPLVLRHEDKILPLFRLRPLAPDPLSLYRAFYRKIRECLSLGTAVFALSPKLPLPFPLFPASKDQKVLEVAFSHLPLLRCRPLKSRSAFSFFFFSDSFRLFLRDTLASSAWPFLFLVLPFRLPLPRRAFLFPVFSFSLRAQGRQKIRRRLRKVFPQLFPFPLPFFVLVFGFSPSLSGPFGKLSPPAPSIQRGDHADEGLIYLPFSRAFQPPSLFSHPPRNEPLSVGRHDALLTGGILPTFPSRSFPFSLFFPRVFSFFCFFANAQLRKQFPRTPAANFPPPLLFDLNFRSLSG